MSFKIITTEELIQMLNKYNHKELHMHHTWIPNHSHFHGNNGIELQENMRNYHMNNLGWSDIGQHVSLLPDGRWVTGRDFGRTPASISGYNTGAFCVEMIGDFDIGRDKFEGKQKESMLKLAKYFFDKGKYIRFHNQNSSKSCPGSSIDKSVFMNEIKSYGNSQPRLLKLQSPLLHGEDVKQLQENLNKLGFNSGTPDGYFGQKSENAIKDFQRKHGLTVDGIVGNQVHSKIEELLNPPKAEVKPQPTQPKQEVQQGGTRTLNLKDWQWEIIADVLRDQHKDGILSSADWEVKARNKDLSIDEAILLTYATLGRNLDRLKDNK